MEKTTETVTESSPDQVVTVVPVVVAQPETQAEPQGETLLQEVLNLKSEVETLRSLAREAMTEAQTCRSEMSRLVAEEVEEIEEATPVAAVEPLPETNPEPPKIKRNLFQRVFLGMSN